MVSEVEPSNGNQRGQATFRFSLSPKSSAFPYFFLYFSRSISSRQERIRAGEFLIQLHDLFIAGQFFDRLLQFFAALRWRRALELVFSSNPIPIQIAGREPETKDRLFD